MKTTITKKLSLFLITFVTFSVAVNAQTAIKADKSEVVWKGHKVTGSHEGTINVKSGNLEFKKNKLVGGEVTIDMTTINVTDLEGEYKGKLEGHLKSDDFFGVANYATSKIVFTKVKAKGKGSYEVTGDLTIKGKTHSITFTLSIYSNKASASLKVDRTKYDIKYSSASFFDGLKDKAIDNEFDLIVDLEF